jgi:hypothetical protein
MRSPGSDWIYVVIGMRLVMAVSGHNCNPAPSRAWLESHSYHRFIATICTVSIGVAFQHPNCGASPSSAAPGVPGCTHKALATMHL